MVKRQAFGSVASVGGKVMRSLKAVALADLAAVSFGWYRSTLAFASGSCSAVA